VIGRLEKLLEQSVESKAKVSEYKQQINRVNEEIVRLEQ
jgi:hypothetical protein